MVEGEVAALAAAAGASDAAIAELRRLIDLQREVATAGGTGHEQDARFHCRLAALPGNEMLEIIVARLWKDMVTPIFLRLAQPSDGQRNINATLADHLAIVAAVERRDAEAARKAMHDHIRHTEAWFLSGSESDTAANPALP